MASRLPAKQLQTGTLPATIGTSNSLGSGNDVALANHSHGHGAQALGDGTNHAVASGSVAGFMSAADKTKLDGLATATDLSALKYLVRVATTATITNPTSGAPNTVDSISLAVGDRVLLATGGPSSLNGIYDVVTVGTGSNGVWARSSDADSAAEFVNGMAVIVRLGTTNGGSVFTLSFTAPLTLGTTGILFTRTIGLSAVAPPTVGTANTLGTVQLAARSDHGHDHGAQATSAHHAQAQAYTLSGFFSWADKARHDQITINHYKQLLGAGAVEMWHSRFGIALSSSKVTQWTGRWKNIVVPAATTGERPDYGLSSVFGDSKTVVTSVVPQRLYNTSDLSPVLMAGGSYVYVMSVFRRTTLTSTGAAQGLINLNPSTNVPAFELRDWDTTCTTISAVYANSGSNRVDLACADLLPHIVEGWIDNTNKLYARIDGGSVASLVGGGAAVPDITKVAIGGLVGGFNRYGNFEHAMHLVATGYPGDTIASQLRDFAHADFGF